jgi:hypothetical protein
MHLTLSTENDTSENAYALTGFTESGTFSLQDEIDTLRETLTWLRSAFSEAESLDQRLRLSNSICQVSAVLSRLLRSQTYLRKQAPSEWDKAVQDAINDILREWDRIE